MIAELARRTPDTCHVQTEEQGWQGARRDGDGSQWEAHGVQVTLSATPGGHIVSASAPGRSLQRIRLRWRLAPHPGCLYLGDALERAYGDLAWRTIVPERLMPWYVLAHSDAGTDGLGVACDANALAVWQVDASGVSLDLDCRSGGVGVQAGARTLALATLVGRAGRAGEGAFAAAAAFCKQLCSSPRGPAEPVYGGNNWYYAYGRSSHREVLDDAERVASWSDSPNRPWMVIDDGWQLARSPSYTGGPWYAGNPAFPDMPGLADGIRARGARPGLWYRPLLADGMVPQDWCLAAPRPKGWADQRCFLGPTVPDVRDLLRADMARLVRWGYGLIKHDFTTYDLLGYWGNGAAGRWIADGWSFRDRSRTNAEIVRDLYGLLRDAAGDALLLGCNTIGHLAAGTHELQRTGDDTSGQEWERTRLMGVNTLAFRMPQHGALFAVDADCVGLTREVPWDFNRQWLDLLARSGTPLFVSAAPDAVGREQDAALRAAFAKAAAPRAVAEPLDWLVTTCPARWAAADGAADYDWTGDVGCPAP
jgi:alpha-galactosidase